MRHFYLSLAFLFSIAVITAQDRGGQFWLDGGSTLIVNTEFVPGLGGAVGYFINDRLLVKTGVGISEFDFVLAPSIRYYFKDSDQLWRPYTDAGFTFSFDRSDFTNVRLTAGMERNFGVGTLLNLDLSYNRFIVSDFDINSFTLNGNLNAILGGPGGEQAAALNLAKGRFFVDNQLFNISYNTGDLLNGFGVGISPELGYFLTGRLLANAGIALSYSNFTRENVIDEFNTESLSILLNAGARYYISTSSLFNWYAMAELEYERFSNTINDESGSTNFSRLRFGPGASVFLNENVSTDVGLQAVQGLNEDDGLYLGLFAELNFWFGGK